MARLGWLLCCLLMLTASASDEEQEQQEGQCLQKKASQCEDKEHCRQETCPSVEIDRTDSEDEYSNTNGNGIKYTFEKVT